MKSQADGRNFPSITIFAESGPLAGDLAACLSGRFDVERVTSLQDASYSLAHGCQAMLILRGAQDELGSARIDLIKQAVGDRCRVLILGSGGLDLETDLDAKVIHLPPLPSPQLLFETLADLDTKAGHLTDGKPGMQAGAS